MVALGSAKVGGVYIFYTQYNSVNAEEPLLHSLYSYDE